VLPFSVALKSGVAIHDQVVYAVTRAVVTGQLRAGDTFPSVRALSQELRINPNTSHKIVAALIDDGVLVVRPGIGTVVAEPRPAKPAGRRAALDAGAERLVVDAHRSGWSLQEVIAVLRRHWERTVDRAG